MNDDRDSAHNGPDGIDALPGLARIAGGAWWRTTGWALQASARISRRVLEAAVSPSAAVDLARDVRRAAGEALRDLAEMTDLEERLSGAAPAAEMAKKVVDAMPTVLRSSTTAEDRGANSRAAPSQRQDGDHSARHSLREDGEELLRKSRDVRYEFDAHPAYERILSELAPDEGRILRLLLLDGPQPAVDIRTGGPLGLLRSSLIAPGLSMIGARAGCRYVDRVPAYLNNLFRLGMIWFSHETINNPLRYQVLEAQPDVLHAIHSVRQAKVVRRSIHLTPFGDDFCRVCLTPDRTPLDQLPEHSAPPELTTSPQPPMDME